MHIFTSAMAGLLFGIGILLSGMSNPAKVINFFDVLGTWDPSLAFVMGGALAVALVGYRLVLQRERPWLEAQFHLPTAQAIDVRLIGGAALFGVGWGIAGFCPGGLVPVLAVGRIEPLVFLAGLLAGLVAARWALLRGLRGRARGMG
jgi:uncharacterized protein